MGIFNKFARQEDGAVTVDWVVLTAAIAGFCIAFVIELKADANNLSFLTQQYLEDQDPAANAGSNIQGAFPDPE